MALRPGVSSIQHTISPQEGHRTAVLRTGGIPQFFVEVKGKMIQMIKTPSGEELVVIPRMEYNELVAAARRKLPEQMAGTEIICTRLNNAIEKGDRKAFTDELIDAVRAKGPMDLIDEIGPQSDILYDGLSNPKFFTVMKILRALGVRLTVTPK